MDKEKSIIPFTEAESTTGDHNNRCSPHRMKSNTFIYQTFHLPQPPESTTLHFVNTNLNQLQNH
jgi:hypothetical protein